MKAMVLREFNKIMSLEEMEDPIPGPLDIILRVRACGVCGTDVKIYSGKIPPPIITLPHILGHEIAGEVVEIGSAVKSVSVGQRGIVYFYVGCRDCEMCRTGRENVCMSIKRLGFELPGGYSQYVRFPAYNFCPFEEDVPFTEMAVLPDAVATPYHALKTMADVKVGQDVLIMGVGGLGIHAVQIAKLMGARVVAADVKRDALDLATQFGANHTMNVRDGNILEEGKNFTKGLGFDAVIEMVGSPDTLKWSLPLLKLRGKLIIVGYDPLHPFSVNGMEMHYNEWTISGSRLSTKQELLEVIELVETGKIKPIVAKLYALVQTNEAIQQIKKGETTGRTVIRVD